MPTRQSDTRYININQCFNIDFTLTGASNYVKPNQSLTCREVVINNITGGDITFKHGNSQSVAPASVASFTVKNGTQFTVMGLTNTDQLSCEGSAGTLEARAHFYSSTPQVRQ